MCRYQLACIWKRGCTNTSICYDVSMTGYEVQLLRTSMGLTPQHLASLLGVHLTTVYRWEGQRGAALRLEPLQHSLLLQLQKQATARQPMDFGQELIKGLLIGGTLVGLACLLADLVDSKPNRRRS